MICIKSYRGSLAEKSSSVCIMSIEKFDVLGVKIAILNLRKVCPLLEDLIQNNRKVYICVAPVATIVDCQSNKEYKEVINQAYCITPDGMPLVWLGRIKGHKDIERTYGPDLMLSLCDFGQQKDYKHYLYGGLPATCQRLEDKLKQQFPKIQIAGQYSPPFRELTIEEDERVVEQINQANPDILWVGLGSPKQDFWMAQHRQRLNVPVMIGVGAAFDFLSGIKKQAPRWVRQIGMEWFFRLCCEPRRLAKRYIIGNSKFIYFLTRNFLLNINQR